VSPEPQPGFGSPALPPTLPGCCIKVLGRPGWFDPALLHAVRLRPANLFVRAISSARLTGTEITAITIGNTIYFRRPERFDPHSPAGLALLAHELSHVEQCWASGGVVRFAIEYILEYLRGGYGTNIAFEAEAYKVGSAVLDHLEAEFAYNAGQSLCEITPAGHTPSALYRFLRPYSALPRSVIRGQSMSRS